MKTLLKPLLIASLVLAASQGGSAAAFGNDSDEWLPENIHSDSFEPAIEEVRPRLSSVITPLMHAQSRSGNFRSRGEVMAEVKRRYDAKVLKISLNEARAVYNVRVLMPNGKVKNIQVSARR